MSIVTTEVRQNFIFSNQFNEKKSYLMKINKQFLADLDTAENIQIQGDPTDFMVLNLNNNVYKLIGVNISTSMLVVDGLGNITQCKHQSQLENSSYLEMQKHDPLFHEIYRKLLDVSCTRPDKEGITNFEELIDNFSFTKFSLCSQFLLNQQNFQKLKSALGFITINSEMDEQNSPRLIYISLSFAVWIMRAIIDIYSSIAPSFFHPVSQLLILQKIPILNIDILRWVQNLYHFDEVQINGNHQVKMTHKSIARFVISEMAVSKKQYLATQFDEIVDEMILLFMPAEAQISSLWLKQNLQEKQELLSCKYDYFIEIKQDRYVYYDFLDLQSDLNSKIKFLSKFKKRWRAQQLKAIFRGIASTEEGKDLSIGQILLKKFRKYGEQYEIKFILPGK